MTTFTASSTGQPLRGTNTRRPSHRHQGAMPQGVHTSRDPVQGRDSTARSLLNSQARTGLLASLPALSPRMHKLLVHGDQESAYSPNNRQRGGKNTASSDHAWAVTRALAADAVRVGWDRASFVQVLVDGPYKAGHHARSIQHRRGYDRAAEWVRRAWDGAKEHVGATDRICTRQDFHSSLAAFRARVERTPWKGIAGKTDLRNLIARMEICTRSGGWDHTVSERELAERMGCSRTTARNSNQRLLGERLLRQLDKGSATEGARWMLISPVHRSSHHWTTPQGPKAGGAMSGSTVRHSPPEADISSLAAARLMHLDAFAHYGLGGSGLALVAALAEREGQTVQELQCAASISRATAYRQLRKLLELGLVLRDGEVYALSPRATEGIGERTHLAQVPVSGWEEVATRLGTGGTARRRRQQHEAHRLSWALYQQIRAERRRPSNDGSHPSEAEPQYLRADGVVINPSTGEVLDGLYRASDGRWIVHHG
ncbi:helix-turn-helix domain-containing protein [Streptomyces sp. NPDC056891]|uniref:helix-turn-helix domain-containing protein n=1 Tax=Streptomyces sp. NPDC056891 TaxID=3345961 RepID=UPI0036ADA2C3